MMGWLDDLLKINDSILHKLTDPQVLVAAVGLILVFIIWVMFF